MVLAGAPGLLAERSCPRGSAGAWVRARRPQNERESGPGFPDTSSSAPECLPRPGRGAGERSRGRREAELARGRSGRPGTARPASGPPARARPQPRRRRRPPAARADLQANFIWVHNISPQLLLCHACLPTYSHAPYHDGHGRSPSELVSSSFFPSVWSGVEHYSKLPLDYA
ncbi:uncharacterized protein LOC143272115 [Peromyscus maniculatus bairdii]|uniref:uncharacterized protein LOC143272115 n=1 Tax=Peromyscus maniculatus bairdii TaxID=230844 RepID=UPI003FCF28A3